MGHRTKKDHAGNKIVVTKSKSSKKSKPTHKFVVVSGGTVYDRNHKSEVGAHKFAMNSESVYKDYEVVKVPYAFDKKKDEIKESYRKDSEHGFNRGMQLVFPNAPMPKGKYEILEKNPEYVDKVSKVLKNKGYTIYKIKNHKGHIVFKDSADKKKEKGKIIHLGNV